MKKYVTDSCHKIIHLQGLEFNIIVEKDGTKKYLPVI